MRYNTINLYADLDHANYDIMKFHLPMVAHANPANEEVITPGEKSKQNLQFGGRTMMMMRRTPAITLLHPVATNLPPASKSTGSRKQQ
jgi:hypothetical protein